MTGVNVDLFENQNVDDAIEQEESTHGDVLRMEKESVLGPPSS